jgi:uncharacterized membrane protein
MTEPRTRRSRPATDNQGEPVTTGRLEAFSDGVFAIAATLLVLDLATPKADSHLSHALFNQHEISEYAAFAVSFLVIGITWINHHSLFRQVAHVDRRIMVLNLLLLLDISFLPFPTRVLAEALPDGGANAHFAAFFYSVPMLVMAGLYSAIWWHVTSDNGRLLTRPMSDEQVRRSRRNFSFGALFYVPALGLAFLSAELTLALEGALALYYAFDPLER